ncbi:MAG TPA: molecular chaperone DnaJ [Solirubrobacterales bacterium]|nr:molecular chaperone DnaJ [Solirubrobacterales bacterium]
MPRDPYEILGVDRSADESEIKRAFRRLARELHPDVNTSDPAAEEKFKEAAEAYEILSDAERRRTYDAFGHEGLRSGGFHSRAESAGGFQDIFEAIFGQSDPMFADLFGFGGGSAGGPTAGGDIGVTVEIELADVIDGVRREVEFDAVVRCEHCHGNGAEPGTPIETCATCGGAGQVRQVTRTPFGQMVRAAPCPTCGGDGKVPETPCGVCGGAGSVEDRKSYEVEVPPGIENGQRIRISGAGDAGSSGGPSGDLYVQVLIADDERFHREGSDLVTVLEVTAMTAMLGATLPVETVTGETEVELEAGIQHGETIRVRGEGLPGLRNPRRRGDLHVAVKVVTPVELDDEQRELAERLDSALGPQNAPGNARPGVFERVRRAFR